MAIRREQYYPKYDWSGIAMLTQQLGQLFKPSEAKLLSKQQEHEMNMLQAKQAWSAAENRLEVNKTLYENTLKEIDAYTEKVQNLSPEVADVALKDGGLPKNSSKIFEDNDMSHLSQLSAQASKYHNMTMSSNAVLDNLEKFNKHGIAGKKFGDNYIGEKGATNYRKNFDLEPESEGFLSTKEREEIKYQYLKDIYLVNEEDLDKTEYITLTADEKKINVRPEAIAFMAGYDQSGELASEARAEKTYKARTEYEKPAAATEAMNEWFNLDAAWMNLPDSDKDIVLKYLVDEQSGRPKQSLSALPLDLKDAMLQKKEMDKLAIEIGKSGFNDRIQGLDGSYWGTPATIEDRFDLGTGLRDKDIPATVKPWEEVGLTKEMHTNLRRLGSKAGSTRGAFEHVLKNWDRLGDSEKEISVSQILEEYKEMLGL